MTKTMRKKFEQLLKIYHIQTMIDVPSGDYNWMITIDLQQTMYVFGGDIVTD
jgi:hypothetical protein